MGVEPTTREIFDAYIDHSWRSNAKRQRDKGAEFIIGRREGPYMWDRDGEKRVIDCGNAGGVHSLGHRHPAVLSALRGALDGGSDTGLWAIPNYEYLKLQDLLAELAPSPRLNRSVVTLASTISVDLAVSFAFRVTNRRKILAFRHGYHGHTGFAGIVTGSFDEGILEHYNMPRHLSSFFEPYNDIEAVRAKLSDEVAAVILEPMDYENFAPGDADFLLSLQQACREVGALFVLDETRTGLGRTGQLWAAEHFPGLAPDMMITGKGLSGGLYPVSALMTTESIYDRCMNEHKYSYISSLGGNEISCIVAQAVLKESARSELHENVRSMSALLEAGFTDLCNKHSDLVVPGTAFGCIATIACKDPTMGPAFYRAVYDEGVLCHSISYTEPVVLKFFPSLIIDEGVVNEIVAATDRALTSLSR
ncbi:aminotransferase class III-fold pyridoxal phosphate-dependent enzyme [Parasphingopyxis algicola]|uniref:aminotransferase class III-fold pyridoxal phosphate-dependent enzyme n=1 Tax=Parasphingopyxis algicola TaxID=2026624 RepID=UPI001FE3E08C|nr:aminotransferase class III-fold pyridoxal phosphate-dependent enzyme [Parasphingopyxis algicola]